MTYLTKQYLVSEQKAQLTITVAKAERRLLAENKQDDISLYVGIPFCPTRCCIVLYRISIGTVPKTSGRIFRCHVFKMRYWQNMQKRSH